METLKVKHRATPPGSGQTLEGTDGAGAHLQSVTQGRGGEEHRP